MYLFVCFLFTYIYYALYINKCKTWQNNSLEFCLYICISFMYTKNTSVLCFFAEKIQSA